MIFRQWKMAMKRISDLEAEVRRLDMELKRQDRVAEINYSFIHSTALNAAKSYFAEITNDT